MTPEGAYQHYASWDEMISGPPDPNAPRDALAATCQYAAAFPDLSSPATLVVVRLNVTNSTEGTSVTHIGTSVTENVADCHMHDLAGPRRRARRVALRRAGDGPRPLRRDGPAPSSGAPRAGASRAARAADGPQLLQAGLRGRVRVPECYERFGFTDLRSVRRLGGANGGARRVVTATARARVGRRAGGGRVYDRRTRA